MRQFVREALKRARFDGVVAMLLPAARPVKARRSARVASGRRRLCRRYSHRCRWAIPVRMKR